MHLGYLLAYIDKWNDGLLHEKYVFSKCSVFVIFKRQIFDICYKKSNLTYDTIMFKVNPETYRNYKKQYVEQDTIIEQSFTEMQRKDHNRHRYLFFRCKKLYLLNPCKDTVIRKWGIHFHKVSIFSVNFMTGGK